MVWGNGTNMKAETIALWGLLWFTSFLDIPSLQIFGDSQALINHMLGLSSISYPHLQGRLRNIEYLKRSFQHISFHHIHWDPVGCMHIILRMANYSMDVGTMTLPGWCLLIELTQSSPWQPNAVLMFLFFMVFYSRLWCWFMDTIFGLLL